jgi:DNA-binding response OmpR family regulator
VSKRILVVDDKATLLSLMRMLLEDERYHVSVLQEGSGAVEHIRTAQPDLVILDLKLEDADGLDILRHLKAQQSTSDIPVIVYSAAVLESEQVANLIDDDPAHYGNVSVLQKPFDLDALLERVQTVLGAAEPS